MPGSKWPDGLRLGWTIEDGFLKLHVVERVGEEDVARATTGVPLRILARAIDAEKNEPPADPESEAR